MRGSAMNSHRPHSLWTRQFALLLVMQMFFGFSWGVYFLLPKFLHLQLGLDATGVGIFVGIAGLAAFASIYATGRLIDRLGRKPCILIGTSLLALAGIL